MQYYQVYTNPVEMYCYTIHLLRKLTFLIVQQPLPYHTLFSKYNFVFVTLCFCLEFYFTMIQSYKKLPNLESKKVTFMPFF